MELVNVRHKWFVILHFIGANNNDVECNKDIAMASIHPTVVGQQQQSKIAIKIPAPMSWC